MDKTSRPTNMCLKGQVFRLGRGWVIQANIPWSVLADQGFFILPETMTLGESLSRRHRDIEFHVPTILKGSVLGEAFLCPKQNRLWFDDIVVLNADPGLVDCLAQGKEGSSFIQIASDPEEELSIAGSMTRAWSAEDDLLEYLCEHTNAFRHLSARSYWELRQFAETILKQTQDYKLLAMLIETLTPFVGWEKGLDRSDLVNLTKVTKGALASPPQTWCGLAPSLVESVPSVEAFDF